MSIPSVDLLVDRHIRRAPCREGRHEPVGFAKLIRAPSAVRSARARRCTVGKENDSRWKTKISRRGLVTEWHLSPSQPIMLVHNVLPLEVAITQCHDSRANVA